MREIICLREPRMCRALETASAMAASASFLFLAGAAAAALAAASGPGSTIWHTASALEELQHSCLTCPLSMPGKCRSCTHHGVLSLPMKVTTTCKVVVNNQTSVLCQCSRGVAGQTWYRHAHKAAAPLTYREARAIAVIQQ